MDAAAKENSRRLLREAMRCERTRPLWRIDRRSMHRVPTVPVGTLELALD